MMSSDAGDWLGKIPTEDRLTSAIRVVLASAALLIILADPSEPDRFVAVTYATLSLYTVFSLAVLAGIRRSWGWARRLSPWCHWLDVAWYTLLVALSSGTHSIFFFGLFFPILVASFRHGFPAGLAVTAVSALAFTLVALRAAPPEADFPWNRLLLRPTYLLLLGYMIAYWGGLEIRMKRRLALLSTIATLSNPRYGADRVLGAALNPIREFFTADTCLLAVREESGPTLLMRSSASCTDPLPEEVDPGLGDLLLQLPPELSAASDQRPRWAWLGLSKPYLALDRPAAHRRRTEAVAAALGAEKLLTVPLSYGGGKMGRLYVLRRRRPFGAADLEFACQVIRQLLPVLDHIELVDRLALSAAEEERTRVARDIHDSVIQPYLGLQMGLAAIRDRLRRGGDAARGVEQLIHTADSAIEDLRRYVRQLRSPGARAESLVEALERFASRFGELTGIEIGVEVQQDLEISDRLAGEAFQMVAEGLSNVRRHSQARRAEVRLTQPNGLLTIEIANPGPATAPQFSPRSITERAESLGGRVRVLAGRRGRTSVRVEIPVEGRRET